MNTIRHRRDLWRLLSLLKPGLNLAEIGVAEGRFSEEMLMWPISFPHLYMVDRWACEPNKFGDSSMPQAWHDSNKRDAYNRTLRFGSRPILLAGDSVRMSATVPDRSLMLVYVDADHTFEGVSRDIAAWIRKLATGGVMAFHDYLNVNYGVRRAVDEFCEGKFPVHLLPEDKPEDAGAYFILDPHAHTV